jgi:iron complex outermembrane receptor protein
MEGNVRRHPERYLSALGAKFDSFPNGTDGYLSVAGSANTALTAAGFPTPPLQPYDFSGNDLPNAPRFSAPLNYAHAFPMPADAALSPILSIYYQTRSFLDASNEPATEQNSYANVDATLRFDPSSKSYFVEGYVYNLGDKRIILAPQTESWGLIASAYGPPRRFGVRAGFKF